MYPEHWYRITPVRGYCGVSSFETREVGTVRSSLRFCWQRGSSVPEWSWQEKRKRALPEGNPPGISCRRLIPMSAGEMVARAFSPSSFLKSGNASTSAFVLNLCLYRKKINLSTSLAGQAVGVKEVEDGIWLVSFMDYDLGYIDLEEKTLQPLENPFGPKVLPMS